MRRQAARGPYFSGPLPRILAHRGFTGPDPQDQVPENTLAAFRRALAAGASHLESDVHATRDGVAVLVHDAEIVDADGLHVVVADVDWSLLQSVDLGRGNRVPTLAEALAALPDARFNLDIKAVGAADGMVADIRAANATGRVLVTSFSQQRRRAVVRQLPGVATSASAIAFLVALIAAKLGLRALVRLALHDVDALQIPERAAGIHCTGPRTLRGLRAFGGEVHIWTVNDRESMRRLHAAGVDGVVTDRTDRAVAALRAGS